MCGPRQGYTERTGTCLGSGRFRIRKGAKPLKGLGAVSKHILWPWFLQAPVFTMGPNTFDSGNLPCYSKR